MTRYRNDGEPWANRKDTGRAKDWRPSAPFQLTCHHVVIFVSPFPRRGQEVYCKRCQDSRTVVQSGDEYTARCRNCRYNARFGRALHRCRDGMSRHRSKYPEHTVDSFREGKLYETYEPMTYGELPLIEMSDVRPDDTIPF